MSLLAAASLAAPAGAHAASGQLTMMQDDSLVLRSGPAVRAATLDEMAALGADVVKVQLYWNEVAPAGRRKPAGFDATNPAAYDWGAYDEVVASIRARGMRPFLALGNRAPDWAVGKRTRRYSGTYRPRASEFERFALAAGRRYEEVNLWSIWNEPNLLSWLGPQRGRGGVPLAPSIYRGLYLAGYRGLRASGNGADTILLGELMPLGAGSSQKIPPVAFLREMACLDSRYRPYRGRAARARGCGRVRRIPTSGLAHHPYTPRGGVRARVRRDESSISSLSRLTRALDALARRGKLPARLPLWITEFGFQTNPPDPYSGYSLRRVSGFLDESEWISFRNRRVRSHSQYLLRDDPLRRGRGFQRYAGFQMGLRYSNGRSKSGVYPAFRMPAFVRLLRADRVSVFAGLRTAPGSSARVASRLPGGRYRDLGSARLNGAGYLNKVFRVRSAAKRTYRITIDGRTRVKRPARR